MLLREEAAYVHNLSSAIYLSKGRTEAAEQLANSSKIVHTIL